MDNLILLYIALVFLPGILWANIDTKFSSEQRPTFSFFIANSFVFGVVTYIFLALLFLVVAIILKLNEHVLGIQIMDFTGFLISDMLENVLVRNAVLISIVGFAIPLSISLAQIWLKIKRSPRLLSYFPKSKKEISTGGIDVWTYAFENYSRAFEYVRLVDKKNDRICEGQVITFSESGQTREFLLHNAKVLDFDEKKGYSKYELDYLYVACRMDDIWLEFPKQKQLLN